MPPESSRVARKRSVRHQQFFTSGENGRRKVAPRHLAALDFLQSIPMKKEVKIIEEGMKGMCDCQDSRDGAEGEREMDEQAAQLKINAEMIQVSLEDMHDDAIVRGGRKLPGAPAPTVCVNAQMRYKMSRLNDQSAFFKQWESSALNMDDSPLLSSRVFFSRSRGYPASLLSIIAYDNNEEKARQERVRAEANHWLRIFKQPVRDWRGMSYKSHFQDKRSENTEKDTGCKGQIADREGGEGFRHDPSLLDDPDMTQGKNRYILRGDAATGPVLTSVIIFVNHKELKQHLNDQFREKFPHLPSSLTLSKIRNIKKKTLVACMNIGIEISTVAIAFIFFEQLILKGLIAKENRKLSMAVCLLIAAKFNEEKLLLDPLFEFIDRQWSIERKEVIAAELGAFVSLDFSLHISHQHIFVVYGRLLKLLLRTSKSYLGEVAHAEYNQSLARWKKEREEQLSNQMAQLLEHGDADDEGSA